MAMKSSSLLMRVTLLVGVILSYLRVNARPGCPQLSHEDEARSRRLRQSLLNVTSSLQSLKRALSQSDKIESQSKNRLGRLQSLRRACCQSDSAGLNVYVLPGRCCNPSNGL